MSKFSLPLNCAAVALALATGYAGVEQKIAEESKVVGNKVALARQITEPKVWTSANGETLPYRLHVPAKPEAGRKYPLVIHMHGAGSRGTDNAKQMNAGGSDFLSWMTRRGEECVFLAPQCPSGKRWVDVDWGTREHRMHETPTAYLRMAMEIIADARTRYPVDPDRVYVLGISMGGYATWELLQRRPDWFAAALPCCGGGDVSLAARMKDVSIWAFHGEVDSVVPVYRARSMVEALKRVGGNIRYREYPKTNHNAWTPTFTDDTVFDWLWKQRRVASDPVSAAVRRQMDEGLFAGAVVASGSRAPTAFGDQCRVARHTTMTPTSRFDIASLTKTFVAVLCARLAAQGKLDVDAPFTRYLPDHVLAKEDCAITVRDLAQHTGGFAYETCYQYTKDPAEIRAKAMSCRPKWALREKFNYSCLNFVYLGWIAEKVTGMTLDKAVKAYVLDPLGMKATAWGPVADDGTVVELPVMVELGKIAPPVRPGYNAAIGQISDCGANMASPQAVGNAGLFSTADDLRLYVQDLLARRTFEPAAYDLLFTCAYEKDGARRSFGFDMCAEKRPQGLSDRTIYHSGWSGQTIAIDPGTGFCGVCLTARAGDHGACIKGRMEILSLLGDKGMCRPFQHIVSNRLLEDRIGPGLPDSEFRSNAVPVYVIDPVEKEKDVWIYDMNTLDRRLLKDANGVERPFWVRRIARPFRTRMFYFGDVLDDRELLDAWCAKHPGFLGFLQLEWVNDSMMPWQAYIKMGHRKDPVQRVTPEAAESIRHRPEYASAWAAATNRETFARDFLKGHYRKVLSMHANALDRFWMGDGIYTADHLLADWGVRGIVFETTENYSFWQIPLMFVRGAATQYGLDYIWYLASFYRGIDSDGTISGNNRGQATADEPTNGISVSSMKRVMYLAYFSGALGWQREGGRGVYVYTRNPDESKNGTYGPEGRLLEPFHAFVRDNPRGESYRTTAIVVPISRGYSRFGGKAFRRFDYTRGEYTLDALMSVILDYPSNMTEALYRSGTERVMANSKYGDVFDVLCPDGERRETFAAALAKYKVAVVVDDFREEDRAALERDLGAFEAKGGKVVRITKDMVPWTTPDAALGTVTGATCHPVRRPEIERLVDEAVLPTLPFAVKGAVQFGFNRTSGGWLVYLINNGGVVKFGDRAEEIAPGGADVTVELGGAGGFEVRELLTGRVLEVSGDRMVSLTVPNGDVRVLKINEVGR